MDRPAVVLPAFPWNVQPRTTVVGSRQAEQACWERAPPNGAVLPVKVTFSRVRIPFV
jgi:hypothetical protein